MPCKRYFGKNLEESREGHLCAYSDYENVLTQFNRLLAIVEHSKCFDSPMYRDDIEAIKRRVNGSS